MFTNAGSDTQNITSSPKSIMSAPSFRSADTDVNNTATRKQREEARDLADKVYTTALGASVHEFTDAKSLVDSSKISDLSRTFESARKKWLLCTQLEHGPGHILAAAANDDVVGFMTRYVPLFRSVDPAKFMETMYATVNSKRLPAISHDNDKLDIVMATMLYSLDQIKAPNQKYTADIIDVMTQFMSADCHFIKGETEGVKQLYLDAKFDCLFHMTRFCNMAR